MNRLRYSITLLLLYMLGFSTYAQRNIDFVTPVVATKSMGHTFRAHIHFSVWYS
jgi:hypothetical protein